MSYTHGHGSGLNHNTMEVNSTTEVAVVAGKITVNRKFCWMLGTILIIPQQKYLNICKTGCVHIPSHTIFRNDITLAVRNPKNYICAVLQILRKDLVYATGVYCDILTYKIAKLQEMPIYWNMFIILAHNIGLWIRIHRS